MPVQLKITDRCNLACDYCYYAARPGEACPTMSTRDIVQSIRFFVDHFRPTADRPLPVTFFGGEPLLFADRIFEAIDTVGHSALAYHLCTNATLLDETILDALKTRQVVLWVSIDGAEATHDIHRKTRDGRGSFGAIRPHLPRLVDYGAQVVAVVTAKTAGRVVESCTFLRAVGFPSIHLSVDFSSAWDPDALEILRQGYCQLAEWYLAEKASSPAFRFNVFDEKIILAASGASYRDRSCSAGSTFVVDGALGLWPCTRLATDYDCNPHRVGSVRGGVDELALARFAAAHLVDREECAACAIRRRCLGNCCACVAYSLSGQIRFVSPAVCAYERMLASLVDTLLDRLTAPGFDDSAHGSPALT